MLYALFFAYREISLVEYTVLASDITYRYDLAQSFRSISSINVSIKGSTTDLLFGLIPEDKITRESGKYKIDDYCGATPSKNISELQCYVPKTDQLAVYDMTFNTEPDIKYIPFLLACDQANSGFWLKIRAKGEASSVGISRILSIICSVICAATFIVPTEIVKKGFFKKRDAIFWMEILLAVVYVVWTLVFLFEWDNMICIISRYVVYIYVCFMLRYTVMNEKYTIIFLLLSFPSILATLLPKEVSLIGMVLSVIIMFAISSKELRKNERMFNDYKHLVHENIDTILLAFYTLSTIGTGYGMEFWYQSKGGKGVYSWWDLLSVLFCGAADIFFWLVFLKYCQDK